MQDNLRRRPRKRQANTANNLRKSHIQDGGYRALKMATKLVIYGSEDSGTENISKNVGKINFLVEF